MGLFNKRRRVWIAGAFVVSLIVTYALWPAPKTSPGRPIPSPNGYNDFIKAAQLLSAVSGDFTTMTTDELRPMFTTNQEPLRLVRLGLERKCQVPTEQSLTYLQSHINELSSLKRVAQFLSASGRLAEVEMRYEDGARIHLDVVRFGQEGARGGLIIDKLVGTAVENIGLAGLERMFFHLDAQESQTTTRTLEALDACADSAAEYLQRDKEWGRNVGGWRGRVQAMWNTMTFSPGRLAEQKFSSRLTATDRRRRQLLLRLASHTYEKAHGKRPTHSEALVPGILHAVPKDPDTGTNLVLNPGL